MKIIFSFLFILLFRIGQAQPAKTFRFAFLSDTHIGSPDGKSEEDLRRSIADINAMQDIAFVVITGDITELGTNDELTRAKKIFDQLNVPFYIIPGNHDSGWSESGGVMFSKIFGYDQFSFEYAGIRFLGCPSGPYVRMSDGHVPRSSLNWLDKELKKLKPGQPLIFLNHYPIDNQLDNWYEITERLRHYNTWAILCGHGHTNKALVFEDIPGVMGRSNLRAKAEVGGFNLVDIRMDSMIFTERRPGVVTLDPWTGIKIEKRNYALNKTFSRPDYSINNKYAVIKERWRYSSDANIISSPAIFGDKLVVGNQNGKVVCLSLKDGKQIWSFLTQGSVFSSPAASGGQVIFGSADGYIYSLSGNTGKLNWKYKTGAAVMGSPVVLNKLIYIGGSDHSFLALDFQTG
ncbi:MAG TPA: PQQ-binding-like beta-propeller repeat protein, partial [Chitinophagaceae bacterium]|nr:PQQ-binding-like beta-propeller repeat protein [Chitinophagaceae bacterium]